MIPGSKPEKMKIMIDDALSERNVGSARGRKRLLSPTKNKPGCARTPGFSDGRKRGMGEMRVLCVRILQETKALHFEPHPPAGRRGHKGSSDSQSRSPWRHSDHPGCAAVTIHPASASAHPDKSSSGWHPVHALRRAVQNKYWRWRYPAIHSRHRPGRAGSAGGERRKTAYPVVRSLRPA